jgi:rSAM/selenodomain-associated transferase 1
MNRPLQILLFAKAPRPGFVKTRLAQSLGPVAACDAYCQLVSKLLRQLGRISEVPTTHWMNGSAFGARWPSTAFGEFPGRPIPQCRQLGEAPQPLSPAISLEIRFAPDDAESEVQPWLKPGWSARPQGDGTLGERLLRALIHHQTPNPTPCVIIGSDCPDIEPEDLANAADCLFNGDADVVLGPAKDGGYWLIGTNKPHPTLFQNIAWSTDRVLQQTLSAANQAGLKVRLLRELEDIDTLEDWRRFEARPTPGQVQSTNPKSISNQFG